jgi:hypothetical protein
MEKEFYSVPTNAYILNPQIENPEEEVRQWMLFELLSHYGYKITELFTEVSVRIGSKPKKADIVIKVDGVNKTVIECKRKNRKDNSESQVKGYAHELKAEYVVWTDGFSYWYVARNVAGIWYRILDLPKRHELGMINYGTLLDKTTFISRFLYWYNSSVPAENVQAFFSAVQIPANQLGLSKSAKIPESLSQNFIELLYMAEEILSPTTEKDSFDQRRLVERLLSLLQNLSNFYDEIKFYPLYHHNVKGVRLDDGIQTAKYYLEELEKNPLKPLKVEMGFRKQIALRISNVIGYNRDLIKRYEGLLTIEGVLVNAIDAIMRFISDCGDHGFKDDLSENQVADIIKVFEIAYLQPMNMSLPIRTDIDGCTKLKEVCGIYWFNHLRFYQEIKKQDIFQKLKMIFLGN